MKSKKKRQPISKTSYKEKNFLLEFLFFIIFLLIKIGEGVKWIFRQTVIFFRHCERLKGAWQSLRKRLLTGRLLRRKLLAMTIGFLKNLTSHFRIQLPTSHISHLVKILNTKYHLLTTPHRHETILYSASRQTKLKWFTLGILFSVFFILIPLLSYFWLSSLPNPQSLSTVETPVTTQIFDRRGILLYEIYSDQNRTPVKLSGIPQNLINATISIEDRQFYTHPGFSLRGTARAFIETVFNHNPQGGSTLTQQLIRSVYLTPQPTLSRKIKEIILSFWAERIYSKNQILEMYFNQIPYGSTAWGVEAASEMYFHKKVIDLDLAQAAYLAGLPSSPSLYSPYGAKPQAGVNRQKEVLALMKKLNYISQKDYDRAVAETLVFSLPETKILAPHFVLYVKDLLEKKYGSKRVALGGLRIITSLDLKIQAMAENVVRAEVANLANLQVGNGAALVTNPTTGEILAMVGSKDYFDTNADGNVNLTTSLRQPGSAIKVVNYALALESGLTAASMIEDTPISFQIPGQPNYSPANYDGKFHGKVTVRSALANSYNIPAVKVLAKLGVANMIKKGQEMGIENWTDRRGYGLSLTLGGGEVTMLDMSTVYGSLANWGKKRGLTPILEISDYRGQTLEKAQTFFDDQAVDPNVAFILSDILADDNARANAFGPHSLLEIPGKTVSVKTGTTNNLRDNWAIGYTPSYVVTAWVGNNDNSPMSGVASGVTGATPIWHKIMENLLRDKPDEPFSPPPNIIQADVCGKKEYFLKGTENSIACPLPSPTPTSTSNP